MVQGGAGAASSDEDESSQFCRVVDRALAENRPDLVSDNVLARVFAAAVRAHALKSDKVGGGLEPFPRGSVTATETVIAATALIRAADLNLWDLSMWFNRPGSNPERGGREG